MNHVTRSSAIPGRAARGSKAGLTILIAAGGIIGSGAACSGCHGAGSRASNAGTERSEARADRTLRGTLVRKGEPVGCSICHSGSGVD